MKIILSLVLLLCIATTACKKEAEHCWQCQYIYSGNLPDRTGDTILCNFTKSDINLRQDKEFDASATGYTRWKLTNCQQQ